MDSFTFSFHLILEYDQIWIRQEDNQTIKCSRKGQILRCKWPNEFVEEFQTDGENIRGTTNRNIHGRFNEDCTILWNTGNRWIKEGRQNLERAINPY